MGPREEQQPGTLSAPSSSSPSLVLVDASRFRREGPCSETRDPQQPASASPDAFAGDPPAVAGEYAVLSVTAPGPLSHSGLWAGGNSPDLEERRPCLARDSPLGGFLGLLVTAKQEAGVPLEMAGATDSQKSGLKSKLFFLDRRHDSDIERGDLTLSLGLLWI